MHILSKFGLCAAMCSALAACTPGARSVGPPTPPAPITAVRFHSTATESAETQKDAELIRELRRRMEIDPGIRSYEIGIAARRGEIVLTGLVNTLLNKERAVALARQMPGVRSVRDEIQVSPTERASEQVLREVQRALAATPAVQQFGLNAAIQDRYVTLSGTVDSWEERQLAGLLVKNVSGVRGVENDVRVRYNPHRPDSEIYQDIASRLKWDLRLDHPVLAISVSDAVVTVKGFVGSTAARARVIDDAWVSGVHAVNANGLQIASNLRQAVGHDAAG